MLGHKYLQKFNLSLALLWGIPHNSNITTAGDNIMNINTVEKCLRSDLKKYPSRKKYLIDLINSDTNLEALTLFEDIIDRLLDFSCSHKSEISEQGMNHMLFLTDIVNPVIDDESSYQQRKFVITERECELDLGDFPSSVENLKEMESTQVFGQDDGKPHYAYNLDALIKTAVNNKSH